MLILEYDGKSVKIIRGNQSYRQLVELRSEIIKVGQTIVVRDIQSEMGRALLKAIDSCEEEGQSLWRQCDSSVTTPVVLFT